MCPNPIDAVLVKMDRNDSIPEDQQSRNKDGARREQPLHHPLQAALLEQQHLVVDAAYVEEQLGDLVEDEDVTRYIL